MHLVQQYKIITMMNDNDRIDEVFTLINDVRANPANFVHTYTSLFKQYNGKIYKDKIKTREGVQALNDLITDLKNRRPIQNKLQWSFALHMLADEQARKLSNKNILSTSNLSDHKSLPERAKNFAIVKGRISEVTQFGGETGSQVVEWLLIDDGLASRKRRSLLLDPEFQFIGIGSCIHESQGVVTVIVLAEDVTSLVAQGKDGYFYKRELTHQNELNKIVCQIFRPNEEDKIVKSTLPPTFNSTNVIKIPNPPEKYKSALNQNSFQRNQNSFQRR